MISKHEFAAGDRVALRSPPYNAPRDGYRIVRLLPENAQGKLQYRIRHDAIVGERMMAEDDLAASTDKNGPFS